MGNSSSSGDFCILNEACCVLGRKQGTEMSTQVDEVSLSNPNFVPIEKDEATLEMEAEM